MNGRFNAGTIAANRFDFLFKDFLYPVITVNVVRLMQLQLWVDMNMTERYELIKKKASMIVLLNHNCKFRLDYQ